jgi:hypothetical protein
LLISGPIESLAAAPSRLLVNCSLASLATFAETVETLLTAIV